MRMAHLLWIVLTCVGLGGCGYQEYMDRFEDTLAENDYQEKVENALGPRVVDSKRGFSLRLPKTVEVNPVLQSSTEPEELTVVTTDEENQVTTVIHHAVFDTPEGTDIPIRVIVFVSQPQKDHKGALKWDALAQHVLEPRLRAEWVGDGIFTSEELKPEVRNVPAGPKLKTQQQKTIPIRWGSLIQQDEEGNEQIWLMGFFELPSAAMVIGYRVSKADYTKPYGSPTSDGSISTVSDAIDMSLTTAEIESSIAAPVPEGGGRRGRNN